MTGTDGAGDPTAGTDDPTAETDDLTDDATDDVLADLFAVIEDRRESLPEGSYTASLLDHEKGENAILEKLGEETTEVILAAKDGDPDELAHESADLVYHLLVLLASMDVDLADLRAELADRRN